MEETNKQENMSGSDHSNFHNHNMAGMWGGCCGYHHHGHFLLRWLIGAVILFVVFWLGVKVGEVRSGFDYGYGRFGGGMMNYQRPTMMRWGGDYNIVPVVSQNIQQQAPATTTPAKK